MVVCCHHAGRSLCPLLLLGASFGALFGWVVLTVEMTGRGDLTLALLVASLGAMVVAMLLNSEPIYASLKRRMLAGQTAVATNIAERPKGCALDDGEPAKI